MRGADYHDQDYDGGIDDDDAADTADFLQPKQVLLLFDDKRNDDVGISYQRTAST